MRNPERIPVMLKYLEKLWLKYPDYRLGQLCWAIAGRDPFHFEMQEFFEAVEAKGIGVDWDEIPEYWIEPNAFKELIQGLASKVNEE